MSFRRSSATRCGPCPGNAFSTTADIRQTLFSFKLGKALEAARVARSAGDQDVQRARQVTALDAIRAYNQLLFAMEQLRVIRANVQSKQTHVDFARNRRAAGVATELEVLRAEVDLENQRAERCVQRTKCRGARALLNTVMVRPTATPVEPTDSLAVVPFAVEFDDAVTEALTASRASVVADAGARADLLVDVTAGDAKPSVEFARCVRVLGPAAQESLRSGFLALVGGDQSEGAALRRLAHGRPRRAGARAAQHRDAADCRARESDSARRAVGVRRAGAGEPHDSGSRAQRRAGAAGHRDDRGELQARRSDAARRRRRAAVAAAGGEHPQSGAVYARERASLAEIRDGKGSARTTDETRATSREQRDMHTNTSSSDSRPRYGGSAACGGTEAETTSAASKRSAAFRCAPQPSRRAT